MFSTSRGQDKKWKNKKFYKSSTKILKIANFYKKKDFLIFWCFFTFWTQIRSDSALTVTNKGVSEVRKGTWDNTELLLQLLQLNVSVDFCWIVNNNITVLRRTAKQFGGRTVITNNNALYITWGGSRVRYRMNYCRWKKSVLSKFCTMHKNWWSLSCEFRLIAYLYNVITAFLVIVPLPPLGGQGRLPHCI